MQVGNRLCIVNVLLIFILITRYVDAGNSSTVVENECIAKDEDEWASLGCNVTNATAIKVSGLGNINPTTGYHCDITCPMHNQNFNVTLIENECITKDEDEWAREGCIVDKSNGTLHCFVWPKKKFIYVYKCPIIL